MTTYVILPEQLFNSPIPDNIKSYMGYPENYLVKDCIFSSQENPELPRTPAQLEDGRWVCDGRFRSYYNYKCNETDANVIGISNNSTNRELYQSEIDQWRQILGEENVFEDISNLKYKEDVI